MSSYVTLNKSQWIIGGVALASVGLLAYSLTRPTKMKRKQQGGRKKNKEPKAPKYEQTFSQHPMDINLVMGTEDGFHAHVAGDKKNKKLGLKFGSRLIKIGDKKVDNLPYEEILTELQNTKMPVTLVFRECPDLEQDWVSAEQHREKSNELYKTKDNLEAIAECSHAIRLHPTNKVYYSNRVLMYLGVFNYDAALEDCQRIRELDPLQVFVKGHYLRGLVRFNMKKYKHAASAFQTVIKLNPGFKKARDRLDECLKILKEEEAQEEAKTNEKRRSSEQKLLEHIHSLGKQGSSEDTTDDDSKVRTEGDKNDEPMQSIFESNNDNNNDDISKTIDTSSNDQNALYDEQPDNTDNTDQTDDDNSKTNEKNKDSTEHTYDDDDDDDDNSNDKSGDYD